MENPLPELINTLKSGDLEQQNRALDRLMELGPRAKAAVPALIDALKIRTISISAAATLGAIGAEAKAALPALIETWKNSKEDYLVRARAADAVCEIAGPSAIPLLVHGLTEKNANTRSIAAEALGQYFPKATETIPALIEALKDENADVCITIACILHEFVGRACVPALNRALKHSNPAIRVAVADILLTFNASDFAAIAVAIDSLNEPSSTVREKAGQALERAGPAGEPGIKNLAKAVGDADSNVRKRAVSALSAIGPKAKEAVPVLIKALKDQDPDVRWRTAHALSKIGPAARAAIPALIETLQDEDEQVRFFAICALGEMGAEARAAIPALKKLSKDSDSDNQQAAAVAVKRIHGKR